MRPSPAAGGPSVRSPPSCGSRCGRASAVLPGQQRPPGAPLPRHGPRGRDATRGPASRAAARSWPRSASTRRPAIDIAPEIVPRVLHELAEPVTIVTEPLIGSVGPLGVLSLAFVAEPRAERARPPLPLDAGRAHRPGARARPGVRTRAGGAAGRRGGPRAPVSPLRGDTAPQLEPGAHDGDPPHDEPRRGRLADSCIVQVPGDSGLHRLDVREPGTTPREPCPRRQSRRDRPLRLRRAGRRRLPHRADPAGAPRSPARTARIPGASPPRWPSRSTANGEVIGVMTFIDGPGRHLRARRRLAGHRGGEPGRRRPVERDPLPAGARRGRGAPARRAPRLLARRRGAAARRRVPGRGGRDLRRGRLVRRVRARRRHRLLQRGRRHGQRGARRRR